MKTLTQLENIVLTEIVKEELYDSDGESKGRGPDLPDLFKTTGIEVKILRGVLGSLVKKNQIEVEPGYDGPDLYCSNFTFEEALDFAL